MGSIQIETERK